MGELRRALGVAVAMSTLEILLCSGLNRIQGQWWPELNNSTSFGLCTLQSCMLGQCFFIFSYLFFSSSFSIWLHIDCVTDKCNYKPTQEPCFLQHRRG